MDRSQENTDGPKLLSPQSTLLPALLSSICCSLAFPPVGWGVVVWFAPIGWLTLVQRKELTGKKPYRAIWLAGVVFWLLTLHWLRKPHLVNYLAWPMLAGYLAVYLPLFVSVARVGLHCLRLPLWLVAPIVWTGLDWIRGHFMTGFLMGSLAHTQIDFPVMIQIANVFGEYGVTFLIVLVAASLTQIFFPYENQPSRSLRRLLPLIPATLAVVATFYYGRSQQFELAMQQKFPAGPRVAIIQGNTLADWKNDPNRQVSIMHEHAQLSEAAVEKSRQQDGRGVDLIIWPETCYRFPIYTAAEGFVPNPEQFPPQYLDSAERDLAEFVRRTGSAILTGLDRFHLFPTPEGHTHFKQYNSSVMIDKQGTNLGTYDKMHLVIMGEYVPFTEWIPLLANLTPITGSAAAGEHAQAFELEGLTFCPNICYETCVPHLVRRHVNELTTAGTTPDVLVNLTNDAWFWGSSELDMHLSCGVFRAVEMQLPLLIAANGGLSAHINAYGHVQQVTPRQEPATLLVDLKQRSTTHTTLYARWGDWFASLCVVCCVVLALVGYRNR